MEQSGRCEIDSRPKTDGMGNEGINAFGVRSIAWLDGFRGSCIKLAKR